jgi:hypothetical protein
MFVAFLEQYTSFVHDYYLLYLVLFCGYSTVSSARRGGKNPLCSKKSACLTDGVTELRPDGEGWSRPRTNLVRSESIVPSVMPFLMI